MIRVLSDWKGAALQSLLSIRSDSRHPEWLEWCQTVPWGSNALKIQQYISLYPKPKLAKHFFLRAPLRGVTMHNASNYTMVDFCQL